MAVFLLFLIAVILYGIGAPVWLVILFVALPLICGLIWAFVIFCGVVAAFVEAWR